VSFLQGWQEVKDLRKKIIIPQLGIEDGRIEENRKKISKAIRENARADLIIFPELVLQGHRLSSSTKEEMEEAINLRPEHTLEAMHDYAHRMGAEVIFGEMDEIRGSVYNLAVYVGRDKMDYYAKTHVHWSEKFKPGRELKIFNTSLGPTGILICFDAAFPEAARVLALKGATTIVVIAAIPVHFDIEYMRIRLRAMAHFNQVYVLFANRCGEGFSGHSAVIDPKGMIIGALGKEEGLLEANIDLAEVEKWRKKENIYGNRRPELYGALSEEEKEDLY